MIAFIHHGAEFRVGFSMLILTLLACAFSSSYVYVIIYAAPFYSVVYVR